MGFIRQKGKLERECLTIIHYLEQLQQKGEEYQLAQMSRDLEWTKERVLNYLHPNRWKTITMNQLSNWRQFHWEGRNSHYRYQYSLYKFVLDSLRRRPDNKWEYNRSKLPILRHYAAKYGYGISVREGERGLIAEVFKICDMTEKYLLAYNTKNFFAATDLHEIEEMLDELDIDDLDSLNEDNKEGQIKE